MTKVLYFHGYHSNGSTGIPRRGAVTRKLGELITIDAPHPMGDGKFKWFSLPVEPDFDPARAFAEIAQSAEYVVRKIREMQLDERDLILFGASQGAPIALYLTLNGLVHPRMTIAAVPYYPLELADRVINKETPILWIAAGKDDQVPPDVGGAWKKLQAAGANLDYRIDPDGTHGDWSPAFNDMITKWAAGRR